MKLKVYFSNGLLMYKQYDQNTAALTFPREKPEKEFINYLETIDRVMGEFGQEVDVDIKWETLRGV